MRNISKIKHKPLLLAAAILAAALLLTGISAALVGCQNNNNDNPHNYTAHITDQNNRYVYVPDSINTIATVGSATKFCCYAGCVDKLIAATEMDKEDARRPYTIAYKDKLKELPTTNNGNYLNETTVNKEKLIELQPDIIISTRSEEECNKLQNDTQIPVIGIKDCEDIFSETFTDAINIIGLITGAQSKSKPLVQYINQCKEELNTSSSNAGLYRGAMNYRGSKGLTGTVSNYIVYNAINAKNVAQNENIESYYDTTIENIITWDPDYIFIDSTNIDKVKNDIEKDKALLAGTKAIKNNNVYFCAPFNMNGTNAEFAICEAYFTSALIDYNIAAKYPNIESKIEEIFTKFYGKNIYPELKNNNVEYSKASIM